MATVDSADIGQYNLMVTETDLMTNLVKTTEVNLVVAGAIAEDDTVAQDESLDEEDAEG